MLNINHLEAELQQYLKDNPHLIPIQERLNKELNAVPEQYRMTIVAKHIAWNLEELEIELKLLQYLCCA